MARGLAVVTVALVFGLLDEAALAGSLAWVGIVLVAILVVANGLGYAELAGRSARSGGAYTLVYRTTEDEASSFLTGWALLLAGLGLCAVLAQSVARHLMALISTFAEVSIPLGLVATGVVLVTALGAAFVRQRRRSAGLAIALIVGLSILALLAIPRIQPANLGTGDLGLRSVLPPLVVAFVGLELITSFQRQTRERASNLPRALLIAPAAAAALAAVLAAVAVGVAGRQEATAAASPLALVGRAIAGFWGETAILVLGIVVLVLALRQGLSLVVRQVFLMSRDGFWPNWLGAINYRRRAPLRAIAVTGVLTVAAVWIPEQIVARVSGLLYLTVLISVNVSLARQPRTSSPGDGTRRGFGLPFHPWVPAITVAIDMLAVPLWGFESVSYALGCMAVGGLVYLLYGRGRYVKAQEGVTVFRSPREGTYQTAYSILVPIANPATAGTLVRLAGNLARTRGGEVVALRVEVVPEPVPLETGRRRGRAGQTLLEQAMALANDEKLPVRTLTRVARSVAEGILDTAAEEHANLIVTGWRGPVRARETSLGPVLDSVVRDASCDVLIVRAEGTAVPHRILVPSAGGPHARAAARLALSLAESCDGEVTLLSVHSGPATEGQLEERRRGLSDTVQGLSPGRPPAQKVVVAESVVQGIVREAADHDLVLLGVSEESLLDRLVFGSVPLQVAARVPATGLVQGSRGVTGVWTRRFVRALSGVFPALDQEEQTVVRQDLLRGAQPGTNYLVLIVLSCIIASLGLLLGSPAVVIGAMLIAPLMSPIMAFSMGLVLGDLRVLRLSTEAIVKGIAVALVIAAFAGLLSPLKAITGEMLARSRPTLLDLAVALASGLAGAYALARKDVSAALPGVAVAASLMPPLATVGLGLAMGEPRIAGGALLLFIANIAAISLAGGVVFLLLGVRPQVWAPGSRTQLRRRLIASAVTLIVIAVPLGVILAGIVRDARQERAAEAVLTTRLSEVGAELVDLEAEEADGQLHVVATVRSVEPIDVALVDGMAQALRGALGRPIQLDVVALPVTRSDVP